ncbi:MAG: glycosyltransferase family 2 protein [Clostridiales bacterium]|nr:glycosyltransferase family 2 protein [Clostridiales bacterium]
MKLLTVAIPSYNSQDYMSNCIESLLPGGEEVEIIIVDDGSKDSTPQIADEYQKKYPTIVRAVHQPNGGHGEAVNAGLRHATGFFYKVVDSDDWVDLDAYKKILDFLREAVKEEEPLDMLISNYVYEKQGAKHKKVIQYHSILPENRYFGWKDTGHFGASQNILMHSVIYRTELLRDCSFELPKHTFYVDNIFVYWPFPYVKKMYCLDIDFYRYFIGREDQSVNEKVMMSRIDQQIRVNKIMIDIYAKHENHFASPQLENYMQHYLGTITMITSILLMKINTEEAMAKKDDVWKYLHDRSPEGYEILRHTVLGKFSSSHGKLSKKVTMGGYKIAQKWIGFN